MATSASRRKGLIFALAACVIVLFSALAILNGFNSRHLNAVTTEQIYLFTALSAIAFVLFVAVFLALVRNILKLYADQRSRVMGTRLRTRMMWGAVLVSLVPLAFMFAFSYGLMNRAVDRWFSQPVTEMRDDASRMALELEHYATANARVEAGAIAAEMAGVRRPATGSDATEAQGSDSAVPSSPLDSAILLTAQRSDEPSFTLGATDYALGTAALKGGGLVVVALPLPSGMSAAITRLQTSSDTYWTLYRGRRQLRTLYMLLLLMMTSLALFASSWLALHLSKQITKPVESLADAMVAVAGGDYGRRVEESATEELGELVRSFNRMAADLEGSRAQVEASTLEVSAANAAIERRRGELETMLETIPNGVATLDVEGRIVLANRAITELLDPGGQSSFLGRSIEEVFPAELVDGLERLMRRSHRMGSAAAEMEMNASRGVGTLHLLVTVALLETRDSAERDSEAVHRGYVLVLENATELLRAQKQSAWKEVARRVAHEIKNPLTPISLSAEQIRRHIDRIPAARESPSGEVIRRCSEVISGSVESMRSLVNQFAALAEFPTAKPQPADLNTIVENALSLFAGRMQNVRLQRKLQPDLPLVMADPEALKRALGNLIDNAVEAMSTSLLRELRIATALLGNDTVELTIADTGSGLTAEMRERLFLPYFSTKQRGTGLGLAIAAKIVQEHGGTIRAEANVPAGAKFIVELRAASVPEERQETRTEEPAAVTL